MKPLMTTDDTGKPIEIKSINPDNLPAQFKFIKIKVQRPPKTNQRIVISKSNYRSKGSSNSGYAEELLIVDMTKLKAMLPDFKSRLPNKDTISHEGLGIGERIMMKEGVEYLENGIVVKKTDKRAQDYEAASKAISNRLSK
jgi:hypothetical protein